MSACTALKAAETVFSDMHTVSMDSCTSMYPQTFHTTTTQHDTHAFFTKKIIISGVMFSSFMTYKEVFAVLFGILLLEPLDV